MAAGLVVALVLTVPGPVKALSDAGTEPSPEVLAGPSPDEGTASPPDVLAEPAPDADADAEALAAGRRIWNTKTMWLQFPAPPGANSCFKRRVYLAADSYRWNPGSGLEGWDVFGRSLILPAGWYTWKECLNRWERAGTPTSTYRFVYVQDSYLIRDGQTTGLQERGWLQPATCCPSQPKQYYVAWGSSLRRN